MATVIPFPARPAAPEAASYWFSGGDIFLNAHGRGVHMAPWQAEAARKYFARIICEAGYDISRPDIALAARRFGALDRALEQQAQWRRMFAGRSAKGQ